MPFMRCTEEYVYIVCAAEIVAQYVDASSINFPAISLEFVALNRPFDRLHGIVNLGTERRTLYLNIC